jgi:hypothetical protein
MDTTSATKLNESGIDGRPELRWRPTVGTEPLRFVAAYAAPDVVTRYEAPVQPDGEQERQSIG